MIFSILSAIALAPSALAAERLDAHGFRLNVEDGDTLDLLTVYRPQAFTPLSLSATALFEVAGPSLVLQQQHGDDISKESLRGGLVATNIELMGAIHQRVGLAVSVPYYWFTGGPSWGDTRISLPVGLGVPYDDHGVALSILPFIDLPTGDEYRFLGDRGTELGGVLAFGSNSPRFQVSMNVGAKTGPAIEYLNLRGGPHGIFGLGMAVAVTKTSAIRAEGIYQPSLYLRDTWDEWRNESPAEATLSYRYRTSYGMSITGGMAVPITNGAGTAFRGFVGIGYAYGKDRGPDADGDGIADKRDECPTEPEVKNGYQDRDGCPDALARAKVTVVNDDDRPVPQVVVRVNGFEGTTDDQGQLEVDGLMPIDPNSGTLSHPFYETSNFTVADLELDTLNERTVRLVFVPGEVRVSASREDGQPINARVRFVGPTEMPTQYLGPDGTAVFELRPGEWRLLISAPEFGTERHDLVIEPGKRANADISVKLTAARAVVDAAKKEVRILEQVHFDSGKDTIKADSMGLLSQVANLLLDNPYIRKVEVQGHTDATGDATLNMELSQRRVDNVTRALVSMGVTADRLVPTGYGETRPIADNDSEAGMALNRRVQFVILEQDAPPKEEAPPEPPPPPPPKIDTEGL